MRRVHLVLLIGFLSLAATAAEPESRQLPGITEWQGPFKETLIVKYACRLLGWGGMLPVYPKERWLLAELRAGSVFDPF